MMRMRLPLHPTEMTLHRYAEGTLRGTGSLWVRRHLASCHECRASVIFTRSLREALASLPPEPSPDAALIDRVLAERRAGDRSVLPTADDYQPAVRRRISLPVLATSAAAVLVFSVVLHYRPWATEQHSATTPGGVARKTSPPLTEEFAVSEFFVPRSAFASEPNPSDSSRPLSLDGARLRPATIKYAQFERRSGGVRRQIATESVELTATRIDGRDAWRVLQRRKIGDTVHVETLYADRATLRTLGRTIRVQPYLRYAGITVRQRLVGDSLTGWMQTDSGLGRPIARHLLPRYAPYLSDALAPMLLGATTLDRDWRGSFSILGWAVRNGDVSFPVRLRVVGDERVTTPAGTFDCWKVAVDASIGMQMYWVRKSDGIGARALVVRDDVVRELMLTR
jgi:anti-sigma factor RsiW